LPLLETELDGANLTPALEVHPHQALAIRTENSIHSLGAGDRRTVDLHDQIPRLKSNLLLYAIADPIHQSALSALDLVLRANRRCQRNQLDLAQDGDARSVDVR
jgi:hypothetical protein